MRWVGWQSWRSRPLDGCVVFDAHRGSPAVEGPHVPEGVLPGHLRRLGPSVARMRHDCVRFDRVQTTRDVDGDLARFLTLALDDDPRVSTEPIRTSRQIGGGQPDESLPTR